MRRKGLHSTLLTMVFSGLALAGGGKAVHAQPVPGANACRRTPIDFSDSAEIEQWSVVNDTVMGGRSRSAIQDTEEGTAIFSGEVSLDNNGGFASVRSRPEAHGLAGCSAVTVRLRGDGQRYGLNIRTDGRFDGTYYRHLFDTQPGEWQEITVPLSEFVPTFRGRRVVNAPALDPAGIRTFGFLIGEKQEGEFRLEIAWIAAE